MKAKKNTQKYAVALLSFLLLYSFILGGLIYNYSPKEGKLVPFYPYKVGETQAFEQHPLRMLCYDIDSSGNDDIIVAWNNGYITIYTDDKDYLIRASANDVIVGLLAQGNILYFIGISGTVYVYQYNDSRLEKINSLQISPGIADCTMLYSAEKGVIIAYTIPQTSTIGVAMLSHEKVTMLSEISVDFVGYGIDSIYVSGKQYIVLTSLTEMGGVVIYPYNSGIITTPGKYINTNTRVTSVLNGFFFSTTTPSLATINYNTDNISFYSIDTNISNIQYLMSIKTYSRPYKGIVKDFNHDNLDDIAVLAFRQNVLVLVYPAFNTTLGYSVGRSPVDLDVCNLGDAGNYICVLNKYSMDISFISLNNRTNTPIFIGHSILIGDLWHFQVNSTTYVLYVSQSPPEVILTALNRSNPHTLVIYRGKGIISVSTMLPVKESTVVFVVSDSNISNISFLTIDFSSSTPYIIDQRNISADLNITAMDTGDINNDGYEDLAYVAYAEPRSLIGVIYIDSNGYNKKYFKFGPGRPVFIQLVDFNNDGWLDAIITDINGNRYIYYGDCTGGFVTDNAMEISTSLR